jgi:hypothetical protein
MAGQFSTHFAAASRVGWWIIAGCGLGVLVLGLISSSSRAQRTAESVRSELAEFVPNPV